jgi:6-phosphogluconolactonase
VRVDPLRPTRFREIDDLVENLAREITSRLNAAVNKRGEASLVVPGGSTPGLLFDALSRRDAAWDKVTVTVCDERWAPADPTDSNEHLVRARLLKLRAAGAKFVSMNTKAATAAEGAPVIDAAIAAMRRPFDVTLLGMGADGHVASLFPNSPDLVHALNLDAPDLVRAVTAQGARGSSERMTLTLKALIGSRFIALMITGQAKLAAYEHACDPGNELELPVRAVLRRAPVTTYWTA